MESCLHKYHIMIQSLMWLLYPFAEGIQTRVKNNGNASLHWSCILFIRLLFMYGIVTTSVNFSRVCISKFIV